MLGENKKQGVKMINQDLLYEIIIVRLETVIETLMKYNRISNDTEAYLFALCEFALGKGDCPKPSDYGIKELTIQEILKI